MKKVIRCFLFTFTSTKGLNPPPPHRAKVV
jgi:hypothetical protein